MEQFLHIFEELVSTKHSNEPLNLAEVIRNLKDDLVRAYKFIKLLDEKQFQTL